MVSRKLIPLSDIEVDWDEQLVDDSQIEDDDEEGFDEEED